MLSLLKDDTGATAVEYAILSALIGAVIVVVVGVLGGAVRDSLADPDLMDALS
jgi:Flp pilus assembly pilin Flp